MSTMGCIPEFWQCQWVGEKTWPGGKEAEGSWTGRWVREKVTDTLLDEQMGTSSNSCPTQDSEPRKRCEEKKPQSKSLKALCNCRHSVRLMVGDGARALDPDVQPGDEIPEVLHRGLKLLPWQRLSYGHQYMHTQEWGSHIQHRLALMSTVPLFMPNVWPPCKLFLFIVNIICSWLLTVKGNK